MSGGRDTQHVVIEYSTNSKWVSSSFLRNKKLRKASVTVVCGVRLGVGRSRGFVGFGCVVFSMFL